MENANDNNLTKGNEMTTTQDGPGLNIEAYIREMMIGKLGIDYKTALAVSDKITETIENSSWMATSRGTIVFERREMSLETN